jgi:hypothetical protein
MADYKALQTRGSPTPTPPNSRAAARAVPGIAHCSARGSPTFLTNVCRVVSAPDHHPLVHTPLAHPLLRGPKKPPPSDHFSPPLAAPGGKRIMRRGWTKSNSTARPGYGYTRSGWRDLGTSSFLPSRLHHRKGRSHWRHMDSFLAWLPHPVPDRFPVVPDRALRPRDVPGLPCLYDMCPIITSPPAFGCRIHPLI